MQILKYILWSIGAIVLLNIVFFGMLWIRFMVERRRDRNDKGE